MGERQIFKIFEPDDWSAFQRDGQTRGSALDLKDGYLHTSTAEQLAGTLAAHFKETGRLILAAIPLDQVKADLKWEPARGTFFPHIYRALTLSDVTQHWTLERGADGLYSLPDLNGDA